MRALSMLGIAALTIPSTVLAQAVPDNLSPAPLAVPEASKLSAPPKSPATPVAVACDAACIRSNADGAVQACAPRIEAEAPGDFEWLMRPYGSIFQQANAPEQPTSPIVRYRGDSIRFLSPQKEWVRAIYECGYDTVRQQVTSVRVQLGVLGKANAVPVLPAPQGRLSQGGSAPALGQTASAQAQAAKPPQPTAPASDRRRVGELDEVSVIQVKPSAKSR